MIARITRSLLSAAMGNLGNNLHFFVLDDHAAGGGRVLDPYTEAQLIVALSVFFIILGCFLDGISMVVLTMGVLMPTVNAAGIDPIWFGIFIVLVVEMAQITPPVGFNLFVLQGMTGRQLTWIAKVTMPMFWLMCVAVALIYLVPDLVTWLPQKMAN